MPIRAAVSCVVEIRMERDGERHDLLRRVDPISLLSSVVGHT